MRNIGPGGARLGPGGKESSQIFMSAEELRAVIEEKTKLLLDPTTPETVMSGINIELERVSIHHTTQRATILHEATSQRRHLAAASTAYRHNTTTPP